MRYILFGAVAVAAIASPAMARDGAGYFGVEGGILFPSRTNYQVASTRVQTVPTGQGLIGQTVTTTTAGFGDGFNARYKKGLDVDAVAGYDFGMFRVEGELGYKRTRFRNFTASPALLTAVNTAPISGVTSGSFAFRDRTSILSGMVNGLVDVDVAHGIRLYAGGGVGDARVKSLGGRRSVFAGQLIAGAAMAIGPNVDLGLKYRYFQTARLRFDNSAAFSDSKTGATSVSTFGNTGKFRSNSLLVSLTYNFGGG